MKASAIAHPNLAIVKYWGKAGAGNLPMNPSISMTLSGLYAKITVDFSGDCSDYSATINGEPAEAKVMERAVAHVEMIRKLAGLGCRARGAVEMDFPIGAGLASSAAGFAALTLAAATAAGLRLSQRKLSMLSRLGSGSSCRSIFGGFSEWKAGYARQLAPPSHWDLRVLSAVVDRSSRKVDTRGGMEIARKTSPLYAARLASVRKDLVSARKAILKKDFDLLGSIAEREAMLLHATALTATPILIYLAPETIRIMREVVSWRAEGLPAYYTADTGANVHVMTLPGSEKEVAARLSRIPGVLEIRRSRPGEGARLTEEHLF